MCSGIVLNSTTISHGCYRNHEIKTNNCNLAEEMMKTGSSYLVQHNADDGLHDTLLAWLTKQFHVDHPQILAAVSMVDPEREAVQT